MLIPSINWANLWISIASKLFSTADVITKWALDDSPWGHRGDTIYPSRTLMRFHDPVTSCIYTGMLFSPALHTRYYTHASTRIYMRVTRSRTVPYTWYFFGRRHVRANIAAYAYLYGIKNRPSLKMHRPLHSRGVGSSQSDAEAAEAMRDSRTRFTLSLALAVVPFYARNNKLIYRCKFYKRHRADKFWP